MRTRQGYPASSSPWDEIKELSANGTEQGCHDALPTYLHNGDTLSLLADWVQREDEVHVFYPIRLRMVWPDAPSHVAMR